MRSLALLATILASAPAIAAPRDDVPVQQPEEATVPPAQTPSRPAASGPTLAAVDADSIPEACRSLVKPTTSPSPDVALPARVSLASCLATEDTKGLDLVDAEESVRRLETAAAPSLELIDGVISAGNPTWKVVALHARGELLAGLVVRMEATVPTPAAGANEDAYAMHDLRVSMLQQLLDPWRTDARAAFAEVDKLARSEPQLARIAKTNAVVAQAIDDSQKRLSAIATK